MFIKHNIEKWRVRKHLDFTPRQFQRELNILLTDSKCKYTRLDLLGKKHTYPNKLANYLLNNL